MVLYNVTKLCHKKPVPWKSRPTCIWIFHKYIPGQLPLTHKMYTNLFRHSHVVISINLWTVSFKNVLEVTDSIDWDSESFCTWQFSTTGIAGCQGKAHVPLWYIEALYNGMHKLIFACDHCLSLPLHLGGQLRNHALTYKYKYNYKMQGTQQSYMYIKEKQNLIRAHSINTNARKKKER